MSRIAVRIRHAGAEESVVRLMPLQSGRRVARSLPPVRVHDRLACDIRRLDLARRGLVATYVRHYLQILPLLAAGNILACCLLVRQYDLRIV